MTAAHPRPATPRRDTAPPAASPPASDAPRGLVLHVVLSDDAAQVTGTDLAEVAELLRETAEELLPAAATYTTLSLGPR